MGSARIGNNFYDNLEEAINDINRIAEELEKAKDVKETGEKVSWKEAEEVYNMIKDEVQASLIDGFSHIKRDLVIMPSYVAKGLEFDSVISYNSVNNKYKEEDKYLYYVTCTRAQHNLIIYNGME